MAHCVFVFAHSAGGHKDDRGMLALDAALSAQGLECVRFNFDYRDKGSRRPDPMPVLQAKIRAVVDEVRRERHPDRLLIGGRSMGGRAASMLAADGFDCDGVLLFAYPLHPAGQAEKLRDAHLERIRVPVLCFNGTRDALCTRELMERAVSRAGPNWTQHWLESADHSFHVLKSSGRSDAQIVDEAARATAAWLPQITSKESPR
jgi:predicted alpha/beta-hydrolase family hydrolase